MLKAYEKQLIEGLSEEQKKSLISSVNAISRKVGLKEFGK